MDCRFRGGLCRCAPPSPQIRTLVAGLVAGAVGAVIGTLGGAEARARLAKAFGKDPPAAILEDIVAGGGLSVVALLA
ncbi:MAG: hypothetical protein WKG00_06110 [Polyangiaceae bacterium]